MTFKKDIFLDIVCFRKLGHNEQDTPAMTQPLMYARIATHPGVRSLYAAKLVEQGVVTEDDVAAMVAAYRAKMDAGEPFVNPVMTQAQVQSLEQAQANAQQSPTPGTSRT